MLKILFKRPNFIYLRSNCSAVGIPAKVHLLRSRFWRKGRELYLSRMRRKYRKVGLVRLKFLPLLRRELKHGFK